MDTDELRVWITGYAAAVATVSLGWNIVNAILNDRSIISVEASTRASFEGIPGIGVVSGTKFLLSVEMVNRSKMRKYVERPSIKLPSKVSGTDTFQWISLNDHTRFPFALEPGQRHTINMQLGSNLMEVLEKCSARGRLRILVKDTAGKRYLSNKLPIDRLIEYCKMAIEGARE